MAETPATPLVEEEDLLQDETLSEWFAEWVRTELVWYAGSFTFHLLLLSMLLLLPGVAGREADPEQRSFNEIKDEKQDSDEIKQFDKFDMAEIEDEQPPELDVNPELERPAVTAQEAEHYDDSDKFEHAGGGMATGDPKLGVGGGGGFSVLAYGAGPKVSGPGGIGVGVGTGKNWGSGGSGSGFGGRGSGHREARVARDGGTKHTERAVTAALIWLANHQLSDGSWSLGKYTQRCKDGTCTGPGNGNADSGATAMGLLPFLAAGQTHKTRGPYRGNIAYGVRWLMAHQKPDGDLRCGANMYSHCLATIALCEAYGLSGDRDVGARAQLAVNFILKAQNPTTGGWRYAPGDTGDTSVVGWAIMALKSAQMAGLSVGGTSEIAGSKWLDACQSGPNNSQYSYTQGGGGTPTMSAVGLLCRQYLGARRDSPMLQDGIKYLSAHAPAKAGGKNIYFWYYATQVMHNMSGYEWDEWNRKMRKLLVETQCRDESCAKGSWDPAGDQWGSHGGRVMTTSLSCLTLEIYYRFLPLFKADAEAAQGGAPAAAAPEKEKAKPKGKKAAKDDEA